MTWSGGMRRRLDLAMTLVGEPRIIFLDEPTTGLDPRSRRVMWDIVRDLVARGVTILLTTQYLEEADRLATGIALLDGGRVVAQGTPAELKRLVPGGSVRLEFADAAALDRAERRARRRVPGRPGPRAPAPGRRRRRTRCAACSTGSTPRRSRSRACPIRSADLDDVFLSLTGRRDGPEVPTAMTTHALTDSATMLRRSLRRMRRYPSLTLFIAGIPVVLLLLFVYVFGGHAGRGLGAPGALTPGARARRWAATPTSPTSCPGSCCITVVGAAQGTAISVAMDMTAGIIARFRTMAIARVVGPRRARHRQRHPGAARDRARPRASRC